ncbi:MAG: DUF423 domain-containing protein [Bdellovibrionales bacterium]|nr:DUF423 domain-containing protein [Bdellovibrionales bacterium]
MGRIWLLWGCIFGLLTVALGAFGAHSFQSFLSAEQMTTLHTANQYLAYHSFALLTLGLWSHWEKWASSFLPGICFVLGVVLFSGSLYVYVFLGLRWVAFITPVGGSLFILGWILFAVSVVRTKNSIV